ncbi:MAG: lysylphosphatidylglycerol synthase transmembrane domain-containing protein [Chloroflexota bacterium]
MMGLVVMAGLAFSADFPKMAAALEGFDWRLLPAILLLTLFNYALRFVKWHYYLGQIGVNGLPMGDSGVVFFSGLSMVVTPGKVGEWLKSYLLRELTGTPFSASAPIIIAERLTDGVAMLLLASVGLLAYGYGWQVLLVISVAAAAVVFLTQHRPLAKRAYGVAQGLPLLKERLGHVRAFYESSHQLLKIRNLVLAVSLGLVSWFGECVAFYLVLVGLGITPSPTLLLQATFILATATLVGSVSMLPGGLAAAEGSIAALLLVLAVVPGPGPAAAATLIIRFCTLWFGVGVGVLALLAFAPRLGARGVKLT